MGRNSDYSEEIAELICAEIASSDKSLRYICESREDFPGYSTVWIWLARNPTFQDLYARAKELQAEVIAEGMLDIADTPQEGERRKITQSAVKISPKEGEPAIQSAPEVEIMTADMIEHRKLRIETRKWLLAKLKPKKYGDKIEHSTDPTAPFTVLVSSVLDRDKT